MPFVTVAALPLMLIPQVPEAPEPVVDGTDRLDRAVLASVAPVPPLATGRVPVTCVERLTPLSVPPSVSEPDEVTVPVRVRPLTVPVPETEVTVPVELEVPAPIAALNDAASSAEMVLSALKRGKVTALGLLRVNRLEPMVVAPTAVLYDAASSEETVLSALKRGNVMALGLLRVNRLAPTVVAPRFVRAVAALDAPVPPLATATVPVIFAAGRTVEASLTKSEPFHAATQRSPETIVMPVVGPAPRSTTEPVPALITAYCLLRAGAVMLRVLTPLLAVQIRMA